MRLTEDGLITPTLLRRFAAEGVCEDGDGQHYAVLLRDDGNCLSHHPGSPLIAPDQMIWAMDMLRALNRELHFDGAWVVVFTHPRPPEMANIFLDLKHVDYGRYALIWVDKDGDPQFTLEWSRNACDELRDFADVMLAGKQSTMNKCADAWVLWSTAMREVLAPKPHQLFKRAKGQPAPSAA